MFLDKFALFFPAASSGSLGLSKQKAILYQVDNVSSEQTTTQSLWWKQFSLLVSFDPCLWWTYISYTHLKLLVESRLKMEETGVGHGNLGSVVVYNQNMR